MPNDTQPTQSETPPVTIALGQEELCVLLRTLEIPRLPGFTIPDSFNNSHAEAALNSLRARGIMGLDEQQQFHVLPAVQALLQAGIQLTRTLSITRRAPDRSPIQSWYYLSPEAAVLHIAYDYNVHYFQSIPTGMSFLATLSMALGIDPLSDSAPSAHSFIMEHNLWQNLNALLEQNNPTEARLLLARHKLPEDFIEAVLNARLRNAISLIQMGDNTELQADHRLILSHNEINWLLSFTATTVYVSAESNQAVLDHIADLFQQA